MQADLGKTYFELFGLPASYNIDTADLATRYRELQRRLHPDRYTTAPESERRLAVQMTAQVNAGYQTLRDPVARGRYLLELKNVNTGEDTDTRMDPAFLMQQMEMRETLDEARTASDRVAQCEKLKQQVDAIMSDKINSLKNALEDEATLQSARALVREMQFLQKLSREIEALE